jgi:poly(3-hydroxybutyrate) depolymerase
VPEAPCAGCTLDAPEQREGAVPLLVGMHGDGEGAEDAAKRWRGPALERGWALLSLRCPKSEGCDEGKWYRWNGHPRWVVAQVSEVQRQMEIDPARIFLAGWSGGATYIGMNAYRWPSVFAAAVYHGGGQPPLTTRDCPGRSLPGYFLVGDKNWAHRAQVRLRAYYERCGQTHTWELIEGADHAAEDKALTPGKATEILGWLERQAEASLVSAR